jgi:hypothetical protein
MARSDTGIASWTMLLWVPQTVVPFLGGLASRCRMRSRISSSESEDMVIEIHYLNLNLIHDITAFGVNCWADVDDFSFIEFMDAFF